MTSIIEQLRVLGIPPAKYLDVARQHAKANGYDAKLLSLSPKGPSKLVYDGVSFGRTTYMDFIIYKLTDPSVANEKRKNYIARASKIRGDWRKDSLSRNMLALRILWNFQQ